METENKLVRKSSAYETLSQYERPRKHQPEPFSSRLRRRKHVTTAVTTADTQKKKICLACLFEKNTSSNWRQTEHPSEEAFCGLSWAFMVFRLFRLLQWLTSKFTELEPGVTFYFIKGGNVDHEGQTVDLLFFASVAYLRGHATDTFRISNWSNQM